MCGQAPQRINPIDIMPQDCREGDIVKIYFEKGGFRVGVYRGISESKPLISNIYGEDLNHSLCGSYQHDWIIFRPGKRKVFCGATSEGANISGYSILERFAQTQPLCTPAVSFLGEPDKPTIPLPQGTGGHALEGRVVDGTGDYFAVGITEDLDVVPVPQGRPPHKVLCGIMGEPN